MDLELPGLPVNEDFLDVAIISKDLREPFQSDAVCVDTKAHLTGEFSAPGLQSGDLSAAAMRISQSVRRGPRAGGRRTAGGDTAPLILADIESGPPSGPPRQGRSPAASQAALAAFRKTLPIAQFRVSFLEAVSKFAVLVVVGETGSGKSTQIPQYLREAGYCRGGSRIAVTQPRRLAASSVAARVAEECGVPLGGSVGYNVRFDNRTSAASELVFLTDGMLLREAAASPDLNKYSVIVVDEAHERSVSTDVLLGLLKNLLRARLPSVAARVDGVNKNGVDCVDSIDTVAANAPKPDFLDTASVGAPGGIAAVVRDSSGENVSSRLGSLAPAPRRGIARNSLHAEGLEVPETADAAVTVPPIKPSHSKRLVLTGEKPFGPHSAARTDDSKVKKVKAEPATGCAASMAQQPAVSSERLPSLSATIFPAAETTAEDAPDSRPLFRRRRGRVGDAPGSQPDGLLHADHKVSRVDEMEEHSAVAVGTLSEVFGGGLKIERKPSVTAAIATEADVLPADSVDAPLLSTPEDSLVYCPVQEHPGRRFPFRIIIMSASMDTTSFRKFFFSAPLFSIPGRTHPVTIVHPTKPPADVLEAAVATTDRIRRGNQPGDVLIFMPGAAEIDAVCDALRALPPPDETAPGSAAAPVRIHVGEGTGDVCVFEDDLDEEHGARGSKRRRQDRDNNGLLVLPAYSALPAEQQQLIFQPPPEGIRKVVVATNIAETSLTVDGIVFVIDSGLSKLKKFNPSTGMDSLTVQVASKATAVQRAGRAGRTRPGTCFRLYTEESFREEMPAVTPPEIVRCDLAATVLLLLALKVQSPFEFNWIDPPAHESIVSALALLYGLGAVDEQRQLSPMGTAMADLPVDPPVARMLIASAELCCSEEAIVIAAGLSLQGSVFVRPRDHEAEADRAHARFHATCGDHITLVNVHRAWNESGRQFAWASRHFINGRALANMDHIIAQLRKMLLKAGYAVVHGSDVATLRALIAGFFFHAARRGGADRGSYVNVLDRSEGVIHPSSVMFHKPPQWILYNELVFTTREYFRVVSAVDPKELLLMAPTVFREPDTADYQAGAVVGAHYSRPDGAVAPLRRRLARGDEDSWRLSVIDARNKHLQHVKPVANHPSIRPEKPGRGNTRGR